MATKKTALDPSHFRETTSAGKAKVDALHLQLQNLLYEVLHLQKEVCNIMMTVMFSG